MQDQHTWYATFQTADSARRAAMVLSSGTRTLGHHSVSATVHPPPAPAPSAKEWGDEEMVEQAGEMVIKALKALLERDVMDRVVGSTVRRVAGERGRKVSVKEEGEKVEGVGREKRSLKGLSFKKRAKEVVVKVEVEEEEEKIEVDEVDEEREEEREPERPKKRLKKAAVKKVKKAVVVEVEDDDDDDDDIESEDEEDALVKPEPLSLSRKRPPPEDLEDDIDIDIPKKKARKSVKTATKKKSGFKAAHATHDATQVRAATPDSTLSPSRSPSPALTPLLMGKLPKRASSPPLDPIAIGLCEDEEDVYYAKLALLQDRNDDTSGKTDVPTPDPDSQTRPRKHLTGSARTEGYYRISHAEKSAYVAQYASRGANVAASRGVDTPQPQPQHVTSSRSNRANARRRAQGLEEINAVQRAVALSKGETGAAELSIKFNQLQTRKKHLRFARSPIHDWGLYAMERIARGEMVIEYVGEIIRAQVADKREKAYERQGIGSSYLFRIDEDLVVDATKKGNLGYVQSVIVIADIVADSVG
jgi:hypothetical protein